MKLKEIAAKKLIVALTATTLVSTGVAVYSVYNSNNSEPPTIPDYIPEQHSQAIEIPKEEDVIAETTETKASNQTLMVICSPEAIVHLDDKAVEFYYSNPSGSTVAVVAQLSIGDTIIAQSGSILPGFETFSFALEKSAKLDKGVYDGLLKLVLYDVETGEKKSVDSEVGIKISVED